MNFVSPNRVYFLKGTIDMDLAVIHPFCYSYRLSCITVYKPQFSLLNKQRHIAIPFIS